MSTNETTAPKTWRGFEPNSSPGSIAFMPSSKRSAWLDGLSPEQLHLATESRFGLLEHQIIPEVDWRTWVLLGGRGSGKTHAGANWINEMAVAHCLSAILVLTVAARRLTA